jgi:protein kinase C substrate 80K-H
VVCSLHSLHAEPLTYSIEPQCCDGSDERPGVCKNACKEIGEAYRKQRDAERKIQKTVSIFLPEARALIYFLQGAKIRSSYIAFAHKEKKRLETVVELSAAEIVVREKEVARLRGLITFYISHHNSA